MRHTVVQRFSDMRFVVTTEMFLPPTITFCTLPPSTKN